MKVQREITIASPADQVWTVLAEEFDKAGEWMSVVVSSREKTEGHATEGASMVGRYCDLTDRENGPIADETITHYDPVARRLSIHVMPRNGKLPIEQNNATYTLKELENGHTQVIMDSDLDLKTSGKLLYPVLKAGLNKGFQEQLEELKHYVETGEPHPRKRKRGQGK